MSDFKNQIDEDIREYQEKYSWVPNMEKNEWAFNFWVLDKLFLIDEDVIPSQILDYHDMGVDAYEFCENTKDLYIIQNKYYSTSPLSLEYVKNDFLLRPINALKNGTYTKSEDLQNIFNKYIDDDDFTVYFQIYITNNLRSDSINNYIKEFNLKDPKYRVEIFYLDDIKEKYYSDLPQQYSTLTATIESVNKGTILQINTDDYKLENILDARYVFAPITSIFRMYKEAKDNDYPIFDKNIREYLGKKGVNKKIYETLLNKEDRKNFFYYNNGVTLICDSMTTIKSQNKGNNNNACFNVINPQIVNGCQTVNSIYEVLQNVNPAIIENEFKDTFVMLKILQIDPNNEKEQELYKNIVKYNNSQNAIDEKTFTANVGHFNRIKAEFEGKGFLLLIKQSDKEQFRRKYTTIANLKKESDNRLKRFGLKDHFVRIQDYFIPLEKLLQVIIAFTMGGYDAYTKKTNLLKEGTVHYNNATNFVKNNTTDTLLDLFLLYKKSEMAQKVSSDKRHPIPYYLIDAFGKYDCEERKPELISSKLASESEIQKIVKISQRTTKSYSREIEKRGVDYNKMIKQNIDYAILHERREDVLYAWEE